MSDNEDKSKYYSDYTNGNGRYYGDGYTNGYTSGYTNGYTSGGGNYTSGAGNYMNGYINGNGSYMNGQDPFMNGQQNPQMQDSSGDINYMEWVMRFLSKWYLFVICVVVAMSIGFLINRKWTPAYTTEGQIYIASADKSNNDMIQNIVGGQFKPQVNGDLLLMIGSYTMVNRTLQKLPFDIDYYNKGRFKTNSLYGREPVKITQHEIAPDAYAFEYRFVPQNQDSYRIEIEDVQDPRLEKFAAAFKPVVGRYGERVECSLFVITVDKKYLMPGQSDFFFHFRDMGSLESEFASRLYLSFMGGAQTNSSVVCIQLTSNDYLRDCDFINTLMDEVIAYNLESKNQEAVRTIDFINSQLSSLSDSLNSSEAQLRQFRTSNNIVDIGSYTGEVAGKLTSLNEQRSQLDLQDAYFESLSKYLTKTVMDEKLVAPSSIGVADPTLLELVAQFNELQQKRSDIGVKNPQYERYSKRMNEIRLTLLEVIKNVRHIYAMERKAFEDEYAKTVTAMKGLPDKEFDMVNYERAYKISDNYYTFLLQKLSEAQIIMASNAPDDKIYQEARTILAPVNEKDKSSVYLMCLVIGLLIPAAYVLLMGLLENKINTEDDVMRSCRYPVISSLLHTDKKDLVLSTKSKRSVFTERYRLLRTRIELFAQRKRDIVVVLTSSESGDGKSYVSLNLAGIYSMVSDRVLLIDMDLRNPSLTKQTNTRDKKGLVHVLIGDAELDEVIVKNDERLGFDFIPSGVVPLNSAELIRSDKMTEILAGLRKRYDYIVVDTSPLGLVSDAMEMMKRADMNLIVVRAMKTNKKFFKNFMQQIDADQVKNVATVLNDVPVMKRKSLLGYGKYKGGYYNYGGSKYGYGYGYGYGSHYYRNSGDKYYQQNDKYYTTEDDTDNDSQKA